jgi:2-phosphosulfolactate phosphatase
MSYADQSPFDARFEWGEAGLRALGAGAGTIVIVDVLSFSTAVDVAIGRGATVIPYRWRDGGAAALAAERGALLAVNRRHTSAEYPYSLSPVSLLALPDGSTIVLPSPNGATLSAIAAEPGKTVLSGCLRNATRVAAACRAAGGPTLMIAAGERWGDAAAGSLRPAYEDLIGAGAILAALGANRPSPEARAAIAAFRESRDVLGDRLLDCASGRELVDAGFQRDVEIAAQLDSSTAAPRLDGGAFRHWQI